VLILSDDSVIHKILTLRGAHYAGEMMRPHLIHITHSLFLDRTCPLFLLLALFVSFVFFVACYIIQTRSKEIIFSGISLNKENEILRYFRLAYMCLSPFFFLHYH